MNHTIEYMGERVRNGNEYETSVIVRREGVAKPIGFDPFMSAKVNPEIAALVDPGEVCRFSVIYTQREADDFNAHPDLASEPDPVKRLEMLRDKKVMELYAEGVKAAKPAPTHPVMKASLSVEAEQVEP